MGHFTVQEHFGVCVCVSQCMYACMTVCIQQVEESERAASVIRRALEKHGVENGNAHYSLVLLEGTRRHPALPPEIPHCHTHTHTGRTTIPDHSNVFYALSSLNDAALMLEHNSPQHSQN